MKNGKTDMDANLFLLQNVEAAMDDDEIETISEESKSPRSRAKTWPEHNSMLMQIFKELANFEIWLRNAEENVENYIGIAIPQTLNEMKSKLKEIQVCWAREWHVVVLVQPDFR